jgi:predicted DNA-binding transcriptional regulator AlpA
MKKKSQTVQSVWVSVRQLANHYGVSIATIWRWSAAGRLPKPTKLSPGATRWKVAEVAATLETNAQ